MKDDNPQEVWVLNSELFPYEDEGISYNQMEGVEPVSDPYHYNEWDYHVQLARPDWATVIERKQGVGDPEAMDDILKKYKPVASRIRHLIDAMQPQGIVRRRGYEEGEELDLNAAVRACGEAYKRQRAARRLVSSSTGLSRISSTHFATTCPNLDANS